MRKLYEKSRIWFAVLWIVTYCVLMSLGDLLSAMVGVEKSVTLVVALSLSVALFLFLRKNNLLQNHGLCLPQASTKTMLYYIPILIMLTANLWYGVGIHAGAAEAVLYILSMLCVGFLEEVIFRGLLFEAMRTEGEKYAILISSLTFGMGHIVNLINGSGMELLPNLLQIVYASAAGFMFVMVYCRSGSLLVCIAAHGAFNALSIFANEANATPQTQILTAILLTVITGSYAVYLAWSLQEYAPTE